MVDICWFYNAWDYSLIDNWLRNNILLSSSEGLANKNLDAVQWIINSLVWHQCFKTWGRLIIEVRVDNNISVLLELSHCEIWGIIKRNQRLYWLGDA